MWSEWRGTVGNLDAGPLGLGGWTLNAQHLYDPRGQVLHFGYGGKRSAESLGGTVTSVAGTGVNGFSGNGGPALAADIANPHGIVVAPDGTVYFSEDSNHVVRRITPDGIITTVAGTGTLGFSGDGGPAIAANLDTPMGLMLAPDGTLYVADSGNGRVRAIDINGVIRTVAGGGRASASAMSVPVGALEVSFSKPHAVARGLDGSLYISDDTLSRIFRMDPAGQVTLLVGGGRDKTDGALATSVDISSPLGMAVGQNGDLYFTEFDENRISRVDASGRYWRVAGTGTAGFSGDKGPAVLAQLDRPHTVDIAADGALYVTDEGNSRVRRIGLDGYIDTVAGNGEFSYDGDNGPPLAASFSQPRVVFVHKDGSLWIADYSDDRIRRIRPSLPGYSEGESVLASADGAQLFVFDSLGRHLRTLDAVTRVALVSFEYDKAGHLSAAVDRDGERTVFERDAAGKPTAVAGPFGQRTDLAVDSSGYLAAVTNAAGEAQLFTYTQGGLLQTMTDAENASVNVHRFEYDALGRLVSDASPGGLVQSLVRSDADDGFSVALSSTLGRTRTHEITSQADGASRRVVTQADGTARVTVLMPGSETTTLPTGSVISTVFQGDPRFGMLAPIAANVEHKTGSLAAMTITRKRLATLADPTDPASLTQLEELTTVNNKTWTHRWDVAPRTLIATSPEGRTQRSHWDERGRITETQTGDLLPTTFSYDERGRPTVVSMGDRATHFEYGTGGYAVAVRNALGETTGMSRDAVGRITALALPDGQALQLGITASSTLASLTPPGQPAHTFTHLPGNLIGKYSAPGLQGGETNTTFAYDQDEVLSSTIQPGDRKAEFVHDPATGKLSVVKWAGGQLTLAYDPGSGRITDTNQGGQSVHHGYDGELPVEETWSGDIGGTVRWGFDKNYWLSSERVGAETAISFGYDDDGLLVKAGAETLGRDATHGLVTATRLGTVSDALTYSPIGEVAQYAASVGSSSIYNTAFERDALGRITRLTEVVKGESHVFDFAYHIRGWLTTVQRDGVAQATYDYDANGNRTAATRGGTTASAVYDAQDRLVSQGSVAFEYTPSGELSSKRSIEGTTGYTYDPLGNLLQVALPDGKSIGYVVDAAGRRVGRRVNGTLVQGLLYRNGLNPVAELNGDGTVRNVFVYGSKSNVPDYMVKSGVSYRIISDHLGSVRLVVKTSDGSVAQRIDYDEFGVVLSDSAPGFQPFGFAGGLYDADTALVRFGARDYDASIGRWVSKDPILFGGGQSNLYVYVGNDPINRIDPTGLVDVGDIIGKVWGGFTTVIGAVIGSTGWLLGGNAPTVGNNAIEYTGNPLVARFTPAVTLGNVICYASNNPSQATRDHERQHTYQGQVLGPLYLQAHIVAQALGYGYSFFDSSQTYTNANQRVHSPANLLEVGPMSTPPRPWP